MRTETFEVATGSREAVYDLTDRCRRFAAGGPGGGPGGQRSSDRPDGAAGSDGLLHVFVPHATAGIAILETGAGSEEDLLASLRRLLPIDGGWRHSHGSAGHGRSHVLPALLPPYATVPVLAGRLGLGTWQSVCLVDLNVDNPRRTVRLSFLPG